MRSEEEEGAVLPRETVCECGNESRYSCPRCECRSCSVNCVKRHKQESQCSGRKNDSCHVAKGEMDADMLLNDAVILDQAARGLEMVIRKRLAPWKPADDLPSMRPSMKNLPRKVFHLFQEVYSLPSVGNGDMLKSLMSIVEVCLEKQEGERTSWTPAYNLLYAMAAGFNNEQSRVKISSLHGNKAKPAALQREAANIGFRFKTAPEGLNIRESNTSGNIKWFSYQPQSGRRAEQILAWQVDWIFNDTPHGRVVLTDSRRAASYSLSWTLGLMLSNAWKPNGIVTTEELPLSAVLSIYANSEGEVDFDGLEAWIKVPRGCLETEDVWSRYSAERGETPNLAWRLDIDKTLSHNLRGKAIVEFPQIHIQYNPEAKIRKKECGHSFWCETAFVECIEQLVPLPKTWQRQHKMT